MIGPTDLFHPSPTPHFKILRHNIWIIKTATSQLKIKNNINYFAYMCQSFRSLYLYNDVSYLNLIIYFNNFHKEFYALYSSTNIIRVTKSGRLTWAGHVAGMGMTRGTYRVLVEKPEGRRPLGRPRSRWKDNVKLGLKEVGWWMWTGLI
jgi:hypothetical protein